MTDDSRVSMVRAGDRWSLLVAYASYEIAFDESHPGELIVHVNGVPVTLPRDESRTAFRTRGRDAQHGDGPLTISAPMPGRVVKVLVKPGDVVEARQGVVIVEAMKMENELRAPRGGRVAEVRVAEGMSVDAHAVVVVLE